MTEEEKKAIERLKLSIDMVDKKWKLEITNSNKLKTILNLIDKQQKEIEYYKSELEKESSIWTKIEKGNEYISKDKIREVLEKERKKQKERDDISLALHSQYISLIDKIKKQLLEE